LHLHTGKEILKTGKGNISSQSTVLNKTQYSYLTRFENGVGTNPEELLAAAHAGCFTMALSMILGQGGFTATTLDTIATVTLEGLAVTGVHLSVKGKVANISAQQFGDSVKAAEKIALYQKPLAYRSRPMPS